MTAGTHSKKRFIDVHIWNQSWFNALTSENQLIWIYINQMCNNIGIYNYDERRLPFDLHLDKSPEPEVITKIFNAREEKIKKIDDSTFLIVDFVKFQHCSSSPLLPKSKVFVSYMRDIRDAGLVDYFSRNQPEVVSRESLLFFKAFEQEYLEFKYYSDNPINKLDNDLTPYEDALLRAREVIQLPSIISHNNVITMV